MSAEGNSSSSIEAQKPAQKSTLSARQGIESTAFGAALTNLDEKQPKKKVLGATILPNCNEIPNWTRKHLVALLLQRKKCFCRRDQQTNSLLSDMSRESVRCKVMLYKKPISTHQLINCVIQS